MVRSASYPDPKKASPELYDNCECFIGEAWHQFSRWLSTFIAAWLSLRLLQSKKSDGFSETITINPDGPQNAKQETVRYAGRTLDLTLFAVTRALDVIVSEAWSRRGQRMVATGQWTWVESLISKLADPTIFATSSALIMWAWFYSPSQLPKAYTKWISSAAAVDSRLIEALRRCHTGSSNTVRKRDKHRSSNQCA
ncbi:integral membrane protein [Daldinia childiae]|uniref:uncharacterized protein n=1 Tax=Daldinia childiae TaxID=326645 RepID=UPI001446B844|nr:uncharacterized protein GL218_00738 [Daldinia childiae]KAF3071012.1 integral membrane protein [Daldinia childiae]